MAVGSFQCSECDVEDRGAATAATPIASPLSIDSEDDVGWGLSLQLRLRPMPVFVAAAEDELAVAFGEAAAASPPLSPRRIGSGAGLCDRDTRSQRLRRLTRRF